MKRASTVLLMYVIGINTLTCQVSDLKLENLSDSIFSIHQKTYSLPALSKSNPDVIDDKITHYNTSGMITKISNYRNDTLFSYSLLTYINDSILINLVEYNSDNSIYLSIDFTYDGSNKRKATYNRSHQKSYDDERRSIDIEYDQYYQKLFDNIITQYDYKGYITEEEYITASGTPQSNIKNKYDYKYNKVEVKFYNNSGKLSWRKKLKYNSLNFVDQSTLFLSNRIARKSSFTYETDSNDNWIKCTEKRELYNNFFADKLDDNTIITVREIKFY